MTKAATNATMTPEKKKPAIVKCVVWDLDNTLWHGVLTEDIDVKLREGVADIIKELDRRGVIHSVASKNDHEVAMAKLKEFGLAEYFLFAQINWDPKSGSIATIKESMNVGFDAIAFIDDQPFERDEVAFEHPEVQTYDVDVIEKITELPQFMPRFVTSESGNRRLMYQQDEQRKEEEAVLNNNQEFLEKLDMHFTISSATVDDLQRVEELTVRTNQLNATGYTYSYDELEALLDSPNHYLYVAELVDKYGTYGKIGVALVEKKEDNWYIKLLLMSCRVMSRGVGTVLLHFLIKKAQQNNADVFAEFLPTDRNRIMYITYKFAGFTEHDKMEGGGTMLKYTATSGQAYPEYLTVDTPNDPELGQQAKH